MLLLAVAPVAAQPANDPGGWIGEADYPIESLRLGEEGDVGFGLSISDEGAVLACEITRASGHARLDEATCEILRSRARFNPARDDAGNAVVGRFASRIRWELPDAPPFELPTNPHEIEISYTITADGQFTNCEVVQFRWRGVNQRTVCGRLQSIYELERRHRTIPRGRRYTFRSSLTEAEGERSSGQ